MAKNNSKKMFYWNN